MKRRAAMNPGEPKFAWSAESARVRSVSSSSSGKVGLRTTSLRSTSAVSRNSVSTVELTEIQSSPADAPRLPPTKSIDSAICSAVRVVVPLSSTAASMDAVPAFPAGSCFAPAVIARLTDTTGISWFSTTMIRTPLRSVRSWYSGNSTGRSGSGAGGASFRLVSCASAVAGRPTARSVQATIALFLILLIGASLLTRVRSVRGGCRLRRDHGHHRAVRLRQVLLRDLQDIGGGNRHVTVEVAVDLRRITVITAEMVQRVGPREHGLVL